MTKQTGRRVQIYVPADLLEKWDALPRYERSAEVAKALRAWWGIDDAEIERYERERQPAHRPRKEQP